MFILEVSFNWWSVHVTMHTSLVIPYHCSQVCLELACMSPCFSLEVYVQSEVACLYSFVGKHHNSFFSNSQIIKYGRRLEKIVHKQLTSNFFHLTCKMSHSCVRCNFFSCNLVCFLPRQTLTLNVYCVISLSY
jgi:hypothetical protein